MADKLEIDAQTGETVERNYTKSEATQFAKDVAKSVALAEAQAEAKTAKAEIRQAVLDKLGLTADEAAALLG
jgi:hypothetical protein